MFFIFSPLIRPRDMATSFHLAQVRRPGMTIRQYFGQNYTVYAMQRNWLLIEQTLESNRCQKNIPETTRVI